MLIRLLPDQVIKEWEVVKYAISQANHEQLFATEEGVKDHLRQVIAGVMHVWAIVQDDEFAGVAVTRFNTDQSVGVKRLEIYALFGFKVIKNKTWATCFVALRRFAEAKNCSFIMALSDNQAVLRLADKLGADTEQRMIVFKI